MGKIYNRAVSPAKYKAQIDKALKKPKTDKLIKIEELKRFKDQRGLVRITNTKRPEPERWYVYGTDWELSKGLVKQLELAEVKRNKGYWSDCVYYSWVRLHMEA